jgi:hypothetical protein
MSTTTSFCPPQPVASQRGANGRTVIAIAIAMMVGASARPVIAAPVNEPSPPAGDTREPTPDASPPGGESPTSIDAALEAGDLSTAASLAEAQRKADPSAENWRTEAQIAERRGDLKTAEAGYRGLLDALPNDATKAREQAAADLNRVQSQARGTVAGEPKSTHREALDEKWSQGAKPSPKKKSRAVLPPPSRRSDDRIVTKWYFWVTVGAIVASAAAVTGIAIRAARDDEPDALGLSPAPGPIGPSILRF